MCVKQEGDGVRQNQSVAMNFGLNLEASVSGTKCILSRGESSSETWGEGGDKLQLECFVPSL